MWLRNIETEETHQLNYFDNIASVKNFHHTPEKIHTKYV